MVEPSLFTVPSPAPALFTVRVYSSRMKLAVWLLLPVIVKVIVEFVLVVEPVQLTKSLPEYE